MNNKNDDNVIRNTTSLQDIPKKLSLWQVVVIGVAYMTPMTVFDTFGIVSSTTEGRVPLAYLLSLVAMLLTAFSYARFSSVTEKPGSAYTYTADSCGSIQGFFVGWCALLDYMLLPLINVLLCGIYLNALMPQVPYWAWVLISASLVTLINCFRLKVLANFSLLFVLAPLVLMIIFIYLVIHDIGTDHGYNHVWTSAPLFNGNTHIAPLIAGASILCFSFLGFDAVTTLSHETENPKHNIPRAVILTTLIGGIIFFSAAWFTQLYFPTNEQFKNPDAALPEIALYVGGALFQSVFLTAQIMNTLASGLASHASASRLLYIMGCDGILNKQTFGQLSKHLGTPLFATLFVGLVSLSALFLDLPHVVNLISFGALTAFTAVNFSIFMKFYVKEGQKQGLKNQFFNAILPLISVATIICLWLNLEKTVLTFGCSWLAIGIIFYVYKLFKKQTIIIDNVFE